MVNTNRLKIVGQVSAAQTRINLSFLVSAFCFLLLTSLTRAQTNYDETDYGTNSANNTGSSADLSQVIIVPDSSQDDNSDSGTTVTNVSQPNTSFLGGWTSYGAVGANFSSTTQPRNNNASGAVSAGALQQMTSSQGAGSGPTPGQTNLDVTDFGAMGDAQEFTVNTVSNSTVVTVNGTNTFSSADIGKVIEVFRAGPWVYYSNWGPVVTQQDIVCLITNVSEGTNLSLSIPCGYTMSAYCVVGTNNVGAFQSAINAASSLVASGQYTNVTINVPAGKYLMLSPYVLDPSYVMYDISISHPAITISSGGITFQGDPSGDSVLMGCGAGMEHLVSQSLTWISPGYAPYVPMRDTLVECVGPVANYQYPLVFQNLTFDEE